MIKHPSVSTHLKKKSNRYMNTDTQDGVRIKLRLNMKDSA